MNICWNPSFCLLLINDLSLFGLLKYIGFHHIYKCKSCVASDESAAYSVSDCFSGVSEDLTVHQNSVLKLTMGNVRLAYKYEIEYKHDI